MNTRKLKMVTFVAALAVIAVALVTAAPIARAKNPNAAPNVTANWVTTGNKTGSGDFLGTLNNKPLIFKTNKVERMRLDTLGNVGIGTNAPTSKLTVAGVIQSTNGGFKFPDGTTQTTASVAGPNGWGLGGNAGTSAGTNFVGTTDNQALVFKTNNAERLRIDAGGNVGIGTASPLAGFKLDVNGLVRMTPGGSGGEVHIGTPASETGITFKGTNRADIRYDGTTLKLTAGDGTGVPVSTNGIVIANYGFVGIGTTYPCAKLHVKTGTGGCSNGAVHGEGSTSGGVSGTSWSHYGVEGESNSEAGVYGHSGSGNGVRGHSHESTGVFASSYNGAYIFEGKDSATANLRFAVERATGNVRADGSFTAPADFAEMMPVRGAKQDYTVGDVVVIGPDGKIMLSDKANAANLAGVYSAQPGFLGDTEIAANGIEFYDQPETQQRIAVALVGIVPVKVTDENGPIRPGDLLTTSSKPGYAMRAKPVLVSGVEIYATGTILGKALDAWDKGSGQISVLVTLR